MIKTLRFISRILGVILAIVGVIIIVGTIPDGAEFYAVMIFLFVLWLLKDMDKERNEELKDEREERLRKLCRIINDMPDRSEYSTFGNEFHDDLKRREDEYDQNRRIMQKEWEKTEEIMRKYK